MTGHSEERIGQKQAVYLTVFLFWHVSEAMIYYCEFVNALEIIVVQQERGLHSHTF